MSEIDTTNIQIVGSQGGDVVVMMPRRRMSPTEAMVHAAWLVAIAETQALMTGDEPDFDELLNRVRNT